MLIGILAFQGDYFLHKQALESLDVKSIYVNDEKSLNKSDALIIPGGESTVISNFLSKTRLNDEIIKYSKNNCVFGTCAGAIIMSSQCDDNRIDNLNILEIQALRNSWGRQIDSFEKNIKLLFNDNTFHAKFIRAPKIKVLSHNIKILSKINNNPILVRNEKHLAATFHPEFIIKSDVHKYFLEMINE